MALFGGKKKDKGKKGAGAAPQKLNFNTTKVISKPEILAKIMKGLGEAQVTSQVARMNLKSASLVSGRGEGTIYNMIMYPFKSGPRPVIVVSSPRSKMGGNFVPADNPMEAGEQVEFNYELPLEEAGANNLYFTGRGPYLQTALYIPNVKEPGKPWVGSREATEKKLGAGAVRQAEEVLQIRVDQVTVYPSAPETFTGDQFEPYIFSPELTVIGGGGVWAKRGVTSYFEEIPDTLDKYLDKQEVVKTISGVKLSEFGVDTITLITPEPILRDIEHDRLLPSVRKKPNDNLQVINSCCGFLLKFEVSDEIRELLMRTMPTKWGKEVEVSLPLHLGQHNEHDPPQESLIFQIFPRDLTQETNPQRRKNHPGMKFMPPFTLHPNAEDHNTYRKLMVAIGSRMKDDARPDEEKNKLASVQAQVAARQDETKDKRVNENVKKAFSARQEAKKRKDMA